MPNMPKVCKFLTCIGDSITQYDLIKNLLNEYKQEIYPRHKACGAIGGASTQGFIVFNPRTKIFTRIK